jgi:hypothetical protein
MTLISFKQSSILNSIRYENMMVGYPNAPIIGTATDAGTGGAASVAFTGVSGATSYTALSSPGSITGTSTTSPITVSGLTNLTAYTFQVSATSGVLTGIYSAASNSVSTTGPSFESIATLIGNGTTGTVTFSSIASTYKSLQIRVSIIPGSNSALQLNFNGDTGNNYNGHALVGANASAAAVNTPSASNIQTLGFFFGLNTSQPNVAIIDCIDYASTTKYKTIRDFHGIQNNAGSTSEVGLTTGAWRSTAAVTSLTLSLSAGNYNTGTTIALYGVK